MSRKSFASVKAKKNGSFRFGSNVFTIRAGKHKAVERTLSEVAINNLVLRVHLDDSKKYTKDNKTSLIKSPRVSTRANSGRTSFTKIITQPRSRRGRRPNCISNNNNHPNKDKPKPKMLKSKLEAPKKAGPITSPINSTSKVVKYRAFNRSVNTKYVISKSPPTLMESTLESPTSFGKRFKNIYQVKRKAVANALRYCFEQPIQKPFEERSLNYKFSKLAVDVRSLRLPAPHWKIKIYMRNKAISSIAFTNKQESERVLKFSAISNTYEMIIDNKKANLLGSPLTIDTRQDVEILLDILHHIATDNPMIAYK